MSDFFDNESEIEKAEEERPEKRKKKNDYIKIIVYALCLSIVIGGCFAVKWLLPKKKKATTAPPAESKEITVLSLKTDAVKSVTVQNASGTIKLLNEGGNWYIDGVKKENIDTLKTESMADTAVNISATKEVTGKMTPADAGLDNPEIKAVIVRSDDTSVSYSIGKKTAKIKFI